MLTKVASELCAIFALATAVLPSPAAADPWAQPPGEHYARLTSRIVVGSGGFLANGVYTDVGQTYVDTDFRLHAEYGINEILTLLADAGILGYATMGERATAYMRAINLAARLALPAVGRILDGSQLAFELQAGLEPGFGNLRIAAGRLDTEVWEYAPSSEHHRFAAVLRLGLQLGWGIYLLVNAGIEERNRPRRLGAIFFGDAGLGLRASAGVDLETAVLWHQPTGTIERHNFTGATGTRFIGARVALTVWLADHLGLYAAVDGVFVGQATRPGPFFSAGLAYRSINRP